MYCEGCGKEISTEGNPRFCSQCGIEQLRGGKAATAKNAKSSVPVWAKGCLITFGIVALLVTLFVAHAIHRSNSKTKKEAQIKANMVEYLNKKYNQKFAISKLTRINDGVFGSWYEAKAYRKDIPEIDFKVKGDKRDEKLFIDYYSSSLWTYQGRQALIEVLNSIYGSNYKLINYTYDNVDDNDTNLNYVDKMNSCKCVYLNIELIVIYDNIFNKYKESNRIHRLTQEHLPQNNLKSYSISIGYVNKSLFNKIDAYSLAGNFQFSYKNKKLTNYMELRRKRVANNNINITNQDIIESFKGE